MGKVLKCDASAGDAYVSFDFGADVPDLWVTMRVRFDGAALAVWEVSGQYLIATFNVDPTFEDYLGIGFDAGPHWYGGWAGAQTPPDATADVWQTVEFRYQAGTTEDIYVDGTLLSSTPVSASGDATRSVNVGLYAATADPANIAYFDDVKFGTTRGASDLGADDFESGGLAFWTTATGAASVIDDPFAPPPPPPPIVAQLYDLASNLLADITPIALEKQLVRVWNGPRSFVVTCPAGHHLLTDLADDGFPNLESGDRKLLVWEDGTIIFHGRIRRVERNGDGKQNLVTITAADAWFELGSDSDDSAGRPVRGSTTPGDPGDPFGGYDGNFINPKFVSSVAAQDEVSGPDLILQVLTNSQNTGAESDPAPGEGPLPIDLTLGTFDLEVPPAVDLSCIDTMDWPAQIGDFVAQLAHSGVVDVEMRPLELGEVADPYKMVTLSAVSNGGSDRSATVHFDYFTGDRNAAACQHVDDFSTVCNKLYDYLGPRVSQTRWKANITPGSPGVTVDPAASRTRYGGQFMQIRVFDSVGDETSARPLYLALFNAELGYRLAPRQLLFITPSVKPLFDAPADFDAGDQVAINTGVDFGVALADTERVLGYTKTWSRENVKRLSQLVTRADVSLG